MRVGDTIFTHDGKPAIVTEKLNLKSDKTQVERQDNMGAGHLRNGLVNGISPGVRGQFNEILDNIKTIKKPEERIEMLHAKIENLKQESADRNLVRYLNAELGHMISSSNYKPRVFQLDENEIS